MGAAPFPVTALCGEFEDLLASALVVVLVFLLDVVVPVGAEVAVGADGA